MDFSKLTSTKRQTKLTDKAHALVDQGTANQKRKTVEENNDALAVQKKARVNQPSGVGHMSLSSHPAPNPQRLAPIPHQLTATGSTRSLVSTTASLGSVGDAVSPTTPSDHETEPLNEEADSGQDNRSIIEVPDNGDNSWDTEEEEGPMEELGIIFLLG